MNHELLASDDSIEPTFIERCITVFNKYPNVAFVMTHRNEVDELGLNEKNIVETPYDEMLFNKERGM